MIVSIVLGFSSMSSYYHRFWEGIKMKPTLTLVGIFSAACWNQYRIVSRSRPTGKDKDVVRVRYSLKKYNNIIICLLIYYYIHYANVDGFFNIIIFINFVILFYYILIFIYFFFHSHRRPDIRRRQSKDCFKNKVLIDYTYTHLLYSHRKETITSAQREICCCIS